MSSEKTCCLCSFQYNNNGGSLLCITAKSRLTLLQVLGKISLYLVFNIWQFKTPLLLEKALGSPFRSKAKNICNNCFKRLESYDDFTWRAAEIQQTLKNLINGIKIKEEKPTASIVREVEFVECGSATVKLEDIPKKPKHVIVSSQVTIKSITVPPKIQTPSAPSVVHTKLIKRKSYAIIPEKSFGPKPTDEEKVICDKCGKICTSRSGFKAHQKLCDIINASKFECKICSKRFKDYISMQKHGYTHNKSSSTRKYCDFCGKDFFCREKLTLHMTTHIKSRNFGCPLCPLRFKYDRGMRRHIKSRHPQNFLSSGIYQCVDKICKQVVFQSFKLFREHMENVHKFINKPS